MRRQSCIRDPAQGRTLMKSMLPFTVVGMLVLAAAGSQAYGPSPGSGAAVLTTEPLVTSVHGWHTDCEYGPMYGDYRTTYSFSWHYHKPNRYMPRLAPAGGCQPQTTHKIDKTKPVVLTRCAAKP